MDLFKNLLKNLGPFPRHTKFCNHVKEEQSLELVSKYQNLINAGDSYNETGIFDTFGKMYLNPNEHFGVCSLSEIKNNKVMWSLYGKKYTVVSNIK